MASPDAEGRQYPPRPTPEELTFILSVTKHWSFSNGLAVWPASTFVPERLDRFRSLATTAPVTLFPSLFPHSCFDEAREIQCAYNELYAAVAGDEDWLGRVVDELADVDDFISNLWKIHVSVKREGYVQLLSLGIFRSDYMVHQGPTGGTTKPEIKQVEFNTIASSFGGLSSKVSALHKHLLSISAYPPATRSFIEKGSLPPNPSIRLIAEGLRTSHHHYGFSKSHPSLPLCILFVVQGTENNSFDQYAVSAHIEDTFQIPIFRLPFDSILNQTTIDPENSTRPLVYFPPHAPSSPHEVTTLYFRAGYSPAEYISSSAWDARRHLERSAAIKCPSILTHLAGSKKIQQILATPSSLYLERFLSGTSYETYIDRIRATFAAIYPLDDSAAGIGAIAIARDHERCKGYVLKPQREGGGNNIYGVKIPPFLASLGDDERKYRSHILMELIEPPDLQNTIFRNGEVQSGDVIGELGIYGVCLWQNRSGTSGKIDVLQNNEAGFLLRTKGRESEEGGVAAGFGAVDSICLYDD